MKRQRAQGLEQYASKGALTFAGSLIVISVAINNSQLDKIFEAYADSITHQIKNECKSNINYTNIENRIKKLEQYSHKPNQ